MTTLYARIGAALVSLLATTAIAITACSQGSEGDRCNPDLNPGNGECNSGLACTQPPLCPEAYCCPTTADGGLGSSSNPYCQTGCNGGAASICNSGANAGGACAFACSNDPSDLSDPDAECAPTPEGGTDASGDARTDGGIDSGGHEASTGDAGPG
jgi:hypothetical protein